MLKQGMSEEEIKSNLRELGVGDVDVVYATAVAEGSAGGPGAGAGGEASEATPSVQKLAAAGFGGDTEKLERKLDDLDAQVKALAEINQKILDTNRQILLRLKE